MATPHKDSTEAEDVLEFLNSLPESSKTPNNNTSKKEQNDEDILDFLDELEAGDSDKAKAAVSAKAAPKVSTKPAPTETSKVETEVPAPTEVDLNETRQQQEEQEEDFVDPIASITSWWSSSGSKAVDSIWSTAKTNATQLREKAQQEANQLNEQFKKLPINEINEQLTKSINEGSSNITKISNNTKIGFNFLNSVYDSLVNDDEAECLKINLIYDLENFQNVDDLVYKNFKKVLRQVQGGVNLQISDKSNSKRRKSISSNAKGLKTRNLNLFQGSLADGEKLVLANLENYINSYKVGENETAEVSHLFLSILPIQIANVQEANKKNEKEEEEEVKIINVDNENSSTFSFLVVLKDLTNKIEVKTRSQGLPIKWASWLDGSIEAPSSSSATSGEQADKEDEDVDPTEWVKDWVDDALGLSFGVVSQSYVVERMGY
ncbi:hypothetical protein WICPIJ_003819 [Wickerhamomyces pijperi]|uniref:Maintenance of telomere capping protein 1 n=1 Tax=Wickerhamomyces pijperi TaxID=599730 RepID=A0A9P8Q953_WICPI|nr:hypothetical protein WICPIJ_003819 [Wickerhamomyces pijperi]